jgi:LysR family transcriptional regulator, chromosome initiation inhibitor
VLGCVTTLKQALRGCKVLPLGAMDYVAVASAAYAQAHCPKGLQAGNFRQIPFIAFNRKDDLQAQFVARALGLRRVSLVQRLQVQGLLEQGDLVNLAPGTTLPVSLYWHCWNLDSAVIDRMTQALVDGASQALQAP